jgi:uncharacterized protein
MRTHLLLAALFATAVAFAGSAWAQTPAGKKELVARVVQLQQPGVENLARMLVEQPAMQLMQGAGQALQRMPAERREAVGKDIQADVRKYVDEATPLVRERALKASPVVLGTVLEERFTEAELKEIIAVLESPVLKRFQQTLGELQNILRERTVADSRGVIEPKLKALEEATAKRLGIQPPPASTPAPAAAGPKK